MAGYALSPRPDPPGELRGVPDGQMFLSYRAVAELLGVDPRTVRRAMQRGLLNPPVRFGGVVRFRREDVAAFVGHLNGYGCASPEAASRKAL